MTYVHKLNITIALLFLISLFACTPSRETIVATESEMSIAKGAEEISDDRFSFATKDELFTHYFADFYNYIIKVREGKEDLESYGIVDLNSFYVFLKTYEGGQGDFPSVGRLLGKYFLRKEIGGSIYDQTPQDGFVGYCLEHDMYVDATKFYQVFFSNFRKEEGVDLKYEHATDFLALPNDSIIDVIKYFYYDKTTLPKYFTQATVTNKLIDKVPEHGLVELMTSSEPYSLNKTEFHLNEEDYFGQKSDTTAIFQVKVDNDDEQRFKKIAFTFDSGVTIEKTLPLLDVLDQYNIKSTFFMTYDAMKESPELVLEIINRGHEIGNHSTTHSDFRKISDLSVKLELYFTHKFIKDLTGIDMFLFRYPYGSYSNANMRVVKELGYYPIQWSNDSLDWKNEGVEQILVHVNEGYKLHSGSIILFHNGADYTIEALPFVIEQLKKDGFGFAKVSDLIYMNDFYIKTNMGQQIKNNQE